MLELISLLRTLARLFRDRRNLMVENLLLRDQLHVALRSHPRPDIKTRDRFLWLLVRRLVPDWKQHLILAQSETVVRWHRQAGGSTGAGAQATGWAAPDWALRFAS